MRTMWRRSRVAVSLSAWISSSVRAMRGAGLAIRVLGCGSAFGGRAGIYRGGVVVAKEAGLGEGATSLPPRRPGGGGGASHRARSRPCADRLPLPERDPRVHPQGATRRQIARPQPHDAEEEGDGAERERIPRRD